jgi:hypothetical protein
MLRLIVVTICMLSPFTSYAENLPPKVINIATVQDLPSLDQFSELIHKTYTRMGYRVRFMHMPIARQTIETNKGSADAMVIKISSIEQSNPNLIRVPVLLAGGGLFLYCQIEIPCDRSVMDEPSNIIGAILGINFTSPYIENYAASFYKTTSVNQLVEMMSKKRLSYILTLEAEGSGDLVEIDKSKYNVVKLDDFEGYHYIHRRIETILPELTLTLKNLIEENNRQ